MTHANHPKFLFFGPLTAHWTISGLLEWIGADNARCHDERLVPILDAVNRALGSLSMPSRGGVVAGVRLLASRVAADPTVGERTLGALVDRAETVGVDRVLVTA